MKILIINPNTSAEMTETIDKAAKKYALPGTDITTVQPAEGPAFIASDCDIALQTPRIIEIVDKNLSAYDYFIIACGFDPGIDACRKITKNVIGIGEASIMTACTVAGRFSYLNTTPASAAAVPERMRSLGVDPSRLASARPVGTSDEIVKKRHEMLDVYCQVGRKCIEEDGAGALVLSCAGMSDIKEILEQRLEIPVIAGVISALKIAEQFSYSPRS